MDVVYPEPYPDSLGPAFCRGEANQWPTIDRVRVVCVKCEVYSVQCAMCVMCSVQRCVWVTVWRKRGAGKGRVPTAAKRDYRRGEMTLSSAESVPSPFGPIPGAQLELVEIPIS